MELRTNRKKLPIKQGNTNDPPERARLLRQYAGIFPNNIVEFSNTILKKNKPQKNFSK